MFFESGLFALECCPLGFVRAEFYAWIEVSGQQQVFGVLLG